MKTPRVTTPLTPDLASLATAWGVSPSLALKMAVELLGGQPLTWRTAAELRLWAERVRAGADAEDVIFVSRERQEALQAEGDWRIRLGVLLPALLALLAARLERGFFFPSVPCTAEKALADLREGKSRLAASYLRAVFPSFWAAGDGPACWSADDERWITVLADRAGANKRSECFDLSWAEIRRGLRVQRHLVSFFQPAHAYQIYRDFLENVDAPRVWDPSCGFGARLLGFFAAYPNGTYCGNEPAETTFTDLTRLARELGEVDLRQAGSETQDVPDGPFDLVFTSPPYFDKERYFDEPTQSWVKYQDRDTWLEEFLYAVMKRAVQELKPAGYLVLNVDWSLRDDVLALGRRLPLVAEPERTLPVRVHHFTKGGKKNEPILVWRKA